MLRAFRTKSRCVLVQLLSCGVYSALFTALLVEARTSLLAPRFTKKIARNAISCASVASAMFSDVANQEFPELIRGSGLPDRIECSILFVEALPASQGKADRFPIGCAADARVPHEARRTAYDFLLLLVLLRHPPIGSGTNRVRRVRQYRLISPLSWRYNSANGGSPLENVHDNGVQWARFRRQYAPNAPLCESTKILSDLDSTVSVRRFKVGRDVLSF